MSSPNPQPSNENSAPPVAPDLFAPSDTAEPLRAVVRRSSRRRRRRDEMTSPGLAKVQLGLLAFIALMIVLNLAGVGVMGKISDFVHKALPQAKSMITGRFELIALFFAALVIIYMMPGVEEVVLTKLGLRRKNNRRERERERERQRAMRDVRRSR